MVSSNAGFSNGVGLPAKRGCGSESCGRFEPESVGVVGADSIAGEPDEEEEVSDDCGVCSSSRSWDGVSERVGRMLSGRGVSTDGEGFRGTGDETPSLGPGTGDGDGRGLFDGGRERDGLGVR